MYWQKESIHQEDIEILSAYAPNNSAVILYIYMKQKLIQLKGEIDKSKIVIKYFSTLLSTIDRATGQKNPERYRKLKDTIKHQALINIYTTLYPTTAEYTLFKCLWNIH